MTAIVEATGSLPREWVTPGKQSRRGPAARGPKRGGNRTRFTADMGRMTVAQAAEWTSAQIAYPNLAGEKDIAERAIQYVIDAKRQWLDATDGVRRIWRILHKLLKGNSLASMGQLDIIHTPELYKVLEAMVPRIEDALFADRPHFRVRPRREISQPQADAIMQFVAWQLDQAKADNLIQPGIRSALIHQVAATKVWWERRFEKAILRDVVRRVEGTRVEYDHRRRRGEILSYDGPKMRLVDPNRLILDTRQTEVEDMDWIGDEVEMTLGECRRMQEMGFWINTGRLDTSADRAIDENVEIEHARNPDRFAGPNRGQLKHGPKKASVIELWGKFDLHGNGDEVECVIAVANEQVALRVSENYHDERFRPYALARCARESWEFYNVGPLDHCSGLNEALDMIRSVAFRASKLSMSPIIGVEGADPGECPDTIWDVEPGLVIPGAKISPVQIPSNIDHLSNWAGMIRQDIEETAGAPRIFSGTDESNTATQAVKNLNEANKRIRSIVRAMSQMWCRTYRMMHLLNRQFVTHDVPYTVLGRGAHALANSYPSVSPLTFLADVDFEFTCMDGIYSAASRATAATQWLQIATPFLSLIQGYVNVPKLLATIYADTVGPRIGDDVITVPPMLTDLMPQSEENVMLLRGERVEVRPEDPHAAHLDEMIPVLEWLTAHPNAPEAVKLAAMEHAAGHVMALERETNQKAAQAGMVETNPIKPQPAEPGSTSPLARGGDAGMDATSVGRTPNMETPGVGSAQQTAKPGRRSGSSQSTNQGGEA